MRDNLGVALSVFAVFVISAGCAVIFGMGTALVVSLFQFGWELVR